jgi:hypothetical protein
MKRLCFLLLAAVAALAMLPTASRADDAEVRKALQANYDKISAAFRAHKSEVMDSLLTPDATLTTPNHATWKRDRIVTDFKKQSSMMKDATWQRTVTAVKIHGNEAVATVKGKFHGTFPGEGGKSHVFDLDSLTTDTWVRIGSAWKLKNANTTSLKPKIDGKEPPAGMGGHA